MRSGCHANAGTGGRCQPVDRGGDDRRGIPWSDLAAAMLLAGHITRDLFGKCIGWREFEFVFNELNARDEETELAVQVQLLQAGVLTVNEVRAMRGLDRWGRTGQCRWRARRQQSRG